MYAGKEAVGELTSMPSLSSRRAGRPLFAGRTGSERGRTGAAVEEDDLLEKLRIELDETCSARGGFPRSESSKAAVVA